jgi:hypothetical protein
MLTNQAQRWMENYLYRARGHRALEESVLAAGERQGFSERTLHRACRRLAVVPDAGCWELHPARVAALMQRDLAPVSPISTRTFEPSFESRVYGMGDVA